LAWGAGFYLLTDKTQLHGKIHKDTKSLATFLFGSSMDLEVINHAPNETYHRHTISTNADATPIIITTEGDPLLANSDQEEASSTIS
jgi:hypothetical protein